MNANARLTAIPGPQKSRKKGRRDKPFRELRIAFITKEIRRYKPKEDPLPAKKYVPLIITDFTPPPGMSPKMLKKLRRKHRRKQRKELAARQDELRKTQSMEQQKAEEQERLVKKRKADAEMYQEVTKKIRTEEPESQVEARQKLEPKSRKVKPQPEAKVQAPVNDGPEASLGQFPYEILQRIFGYSDILDRTSIALTCTNFGYVVMKDLDDSNTKETKEKKEKDAQEAASSGKKKAKENKTNKDDKGPEMRAGYPDIRKRYNWDAERNAVMEHFHSSIAPDHLYCHICRKFKPKNGGTVVSYKNCPKKRYMANKPSSKQGANTPIPPSMLLGSKVEKEKPVPDELIWTEKDWTVVKFGAIRSRMGLVQTCYLCPSCTDTRTSFLFPPPLEMPIGRLSDLGNPIGGDVENGRKPYGQQGPNVRDPRRTYPADEKIATVEESAMAEGKDVEASEINND